MSQHDISFFVKVVVVAAAVVVAAVGVVVCPSLPI